MSNGVARKGAFFPTRSSSRGDGDLVGLSIVRAALIVSIFLQIALRRKSLLQLVKELHKPL